MTRWTRILAPLLIVLSLATPGLAKQPGNAPIRVFVSVLPMKYLVERVGGSHVNTQAMVGRGQSPHTYEPTPRQMTELSRAQIYFRVGVTFEQIWMKRITALNPKLRIVDLRDGIRLRRLEDHHDEGQHMGAGHAGESSGSTLDPHVWTSPVLARTMAEHIRATLAKIDPAHAKAYQDGFDSLAADLTALDLQLRSRLGRVKHRKFLVFHPSWGYFADTYGLQQLAIEAAGKEPGPRSLARIIALARQENIHVIFVQPQFSRTTANTVARAIDGKVVPIDPLAENYIDNLRKTANAFFTSLEN
jgi:zinc transport system substrate-binding protein